MAVTFKAAVSGAAPAPECADITTAVAMGSYVNGCFQQLPGAFVTGRYAGDYCEYRGFLVFDVPPSSVPYVSAELHVPLFEVLSPTGGESFQLREVSTQIGVLTNYSGLSSAAFNDLGDGRLLAHQDLPVRSSPSHGVQGTPVAVTLKAEGVALLNSARGQTLAFGGAISSLDPIAVANEYVGFYQDLSQFKLVLRKSSIAAPQAAILNTPSRTLAGARFFLTAAACGREPMVTQWLKDGVEISGATGSVYSVDVARVEDSGRYEFRASNDVGVATSASVTVEVTPVEIVVPLADVTSYEGRNACLALSVTSFDKLLFEWRKDGVSVAQTVAPTLCFGRLSQADAGRYDVVVRSDHGSVTSRVVTVTVLAQAPDVTLYPSGGVSVAAGLPLELTGQAIGSQPLFYQWLRDEQPIPGATGPRLNIPALSFADTGDYRLTASNAAGSATGGVYRVDVAAAVLNGPYSQGIYLGDRAVLYTLVKAIPETTFQWFRDSVALAGETNAFWVRPEVSAGDVANYQVVVSNRYGVVTSGIARIEVIESAPVVSAFFSGGIPIFTGQPVELSAYALGGPVPFLQWYRNGLRLTGQTNRLLSLAHATTNDSGDYLVVATNLLGSATSAVVRVDVVVSPPVWSQVPNRSADVAGALVTLPTLAIGSAPLTYQWRKDGADLPGQTNADLELSAVTVGDEGEYEVFARNPHGELRATTYLSVRPDTALDHWDWRLPRAQGSRLRDIAWGGGRFVAVGKAGNIATSLDGTNWANVLVEADCDLLGIAYGQGRFVAVGVMGRLYGPFQSFGWGALVLVSTDGLNWQRGHAPDGYCSEIAFGHGRFVLTRLFNQSSGVFAFTSEDGLDWTPVMVPGVVAQQVTFANGEFWATAVGVIYRSPDGLQWRVATKTLLNENLDNFAYGGGRYVALSRSGYLGQTSTDGESWTGFNQGPARLQSIAYGDGKFVGTVSSPVGAVLISSDGRTWTEQDTGTRQELESVIHANGRFWAVGEAGTITTSEDGIAWSPSFAANDTDYYGITTHGNLVIAAGDNGTILTSTDGQEWTRRSTPSGRNLHAVHAANGLVVAGGRGGRIMTSPDGVTWTTRNSGTTNYIERIAWHGLWVAVCEGGDIVTSTNGINWSSARTIPSSDHEGVAFGGGYWLVAGGYFRGNDENAVDTLFVSTNAQRWDPVNLFVGKRLRDVAWGNDRMVAVGNDGMIVVFTLIGSPAVALVDNSFNLITPEVLSGQSENLRRIQFVNGRFVVVGNNGSIFSSSDPANLSSWIRHRSHTSQNLHDVVAASDGSFFAVGNNGMILQSGLPTLRFTQIRSSVAGVALEFERRNVKGPVRLEESPDLQGWQPLVESAVSPVELPIRPGASRYFRLRTSR